jgi:WD40 repeat protein
MRFRNKKVKSFYLWIPAIFLTAGFFAVSVANALAVHLPNQQDALPPIGKNSVWSPKTNETATAVQECLFTADIKSCMQGIMEQTGASPEAIQLMQYFEGLAYLDDFVEVGRVDIGSIFYPFWPNGNIQTLLVNGDPRIVHTDNFVDVNNVCSSESADLFDRYPDAFADFVSSRYEYYHDLPGGGQRFVFSYPIMDGCRACPVVGYAFVAYDFSDLGYFLSPRVLTVSKTLESGLRQFPKPSGGLRKIEKWIDNKITFLGLDGKIWIMESDGSQMAPFLSHQDGEIIIYVWAPGGVGLAYVLQYGDGQNAIRHFDPATGEDKLLVDRAEFYIWGGIAFNPSGDKLAYTAGYTDVYLYDLKNGQNVKVHSMEIMGLGPGVPPLAGLLTWSSSGEYLAADVFVGETAVLAMSGVPTVITSSDITGSRTRPRISPVDPSVAWLTVAEGNQILLTDIAGEVIKQFPAPGNPSLGGVTWSPDGNLILLSGDDGLLALDINSGNTMVIQENRGAWNPQWSPNGSAIIYNHLPPLKNLCRPDGNLHLISSDGLQDFDFWVAGKYPAWYPPPIQTKPTETPPPSISPTSPTDRPYFASIGFKYRKWYDVIGGLVDHDDTRKSAAAARQLLSAQGYHAPQLETISVDDAIPHIEMSSIFYFNGHGSRKGEYTLIYFYDGKQHSYFYGGSPASLEDQDPYRFVSELNAPHLKLVVINGCETGIHLDKEGNLLRSFRQLPADVVIGFNQNISQFSSSRWGQNYWNGVAQGSGAKEAAKAAALQEEKSFLPLINRITVQSLAILSDLESDLIIVPAPPRPGK